MPNSDVCGISDSQLNGDSGLILRPTFEWQTVNVEVLEEF